MQKCSVRLFIIKQTETAHKPSFVLSFHLTFKLNVFRQWHPKRIILGTPTLTSTWNEGVEALHLVWLPQIICEMADLQAHSTSQHKVFKAIFTICAYFPTAIMLFIFCQHWKIAALPQQFGYLADMWAFCVTNCAAIWRGLSAYAGIGGQLGEKCLSFDKTMSGWGDGLTPGWGRGKSELTASGDGCSLCHCFYLFYVFIISCCTFVFDWYPLPRNVFCLLPKVMFFLAFIKSLNYKMKQP